MNIIRCEGSRQFRYGGNISEYLYSSHTGEDMQVQLDNTTFNIGIKKSV
jgi:hypothetical protein